MNGLRVQSLSNAMPLHFKRSPRQLEEKHNLDLGDYQSAMNATTTGFLLGKYNSQISFINNDSPVPPPVNSG